jgi:predicted ATPase
MTADMKIDIHVHTRKVKSGDADTRNIEAEKFGEIIKNTDVKILAITNHNHFDHKQYAEFEKVAFGSCQIWPGIELDVLENGKRAHLIVVVSPRKVVNFNERVVALLKDKNADTFTISIRGTVQAFDDLDPIYIAHYYSKKPNLGDSEIEVLAGLVANPKRILKEASNSISAGIYISHGHNSIYGTDIQDWDQYAIQCKELPELRLPVESFEQFCLLLEKDQSTIDTILNKKIKESIEIVPFTLAEKIKLDIYNDINILFGSKGTGKTEILDALSNYFNAKGHKTSVYKSNDQHLNDVYSIKSNSLSVLPADLPFEECKTEIEFLKAVTEEEITSITKYYNHYSIQETNKISQKIKIKGIAIEDETQPNRKLAEVSDLLGEFREFRSKLEDNTRLTEYIDQKLIEEAIRSVDKIVATLATQTETKYIDVRSIRLLNHIIETFIAEIAKKTGQPQKPTKTGFAEYSSNRIKIEVATRKIINSINIEIPPAKQYVGSLGEKGELYCQTLLKFQTGSFADSTYSAIQGIRKTPQKEFVNAVRAISKHIYHNDLFEKIAELNEVDGIETITSCKTLLLINRHFALNKDEYLPSNGESSMILLHRELIEDKEIYLIDEPEKSLGNDYINDVIVPILKEKAILGKKVIIATHDANIAVRTLPYNSIYRLHNEGRYYTLTGNPFSNTLKCIYDSIPARDWKEISMKTLEGGKDAFGERGKIYGK